MSRMTKILVLSLSVVVFAYVGMGFVLAKASGDRAYRSLTVFGEVLQHIQLDWVEEPNMPLVTSGALHGLMEALDVRSSYMDPKEYAEYKKHQQNPPRGQVGVALAKRFGYVAVLSVLPDSPAAKAGLQAGDILENIGGFTTRDLSVEQAQILLAGEPGTGVKVAAIRRGRTDTQEVDLVRSDPGNARPVTDRISSTEPNAPAIGYLKVYSLGSERVEEISQKLAQFDRQGIHRLVLDLREAAMGETSEGIAAARLFLTSGSVATLSGQTVARQEFAAEPAKVVWKHPVVVLISENTAGAAEIVAAAIGENNRGQLVGTRTFGMASEQKVIPLEDGAALMLTVAFYYTPSGKAIPETGVLPTVTVERGDADDTPADQDPVLKKGLEILRGAVPAPARTAQKVSGARLRSAA